MIFRYLPQAVRPTPAAPTRDTLHRPVIPVRFRGPHGSPGVRALVDTGADETYVTAEIAAALGLTPVNDHVGTIHSASGPLHVWYAETTLEIATDEEAYELPIVVGVVSEAWDELILGHTGFLEFFDAHFSDTDRLLTLDRRH